jgi:hypothetical protein
MVGYRARRVSLGYKGLYLFRLRPVAERVT